MVDSRYLQTMEWRCIGPHRGGRCVAVAGDSVNPNVFYHGASAGGVWKTTDAGAYWENISDQDFTCAAVGAIAVADSDPNVIYVGTGESTFRTDMSHGDGIYKSTDAGKSWANVGLKNSRHIAKIRIHPRNPDVVYAAVWGHVWGPHSERGVYRTTNGGKTWEQVLYKGDQAGAIDLSMDFSNPRILFATLWDFEAKPWTYISGGPNSGLFRSTDGGETWVDLTERPGMPKGLKGKMAVAASPVRTGRVWAQIENAQGGIFRSDDFGDTWQLTTNQTNLWWRAPYYTHIFADTQNPDTCFTLTVDFWKSVDGGKSFQSLPTPHGDNHELWIDPRNSNRMISGNDGGACITLNGGETWSTIYNQPTACIFRMAVDNQFPYRVYGTQMDNSAISVPSRTNEGAIPWNSCYAVGSSEAGHIAVRPDEPNIVYSGAIGSAPGGGAPLLRYDHRTGQTRIITVWPEDTGISAGKDVPFRFQFHFPTLLSPHDPNTLYVAANVAFRSRDEGTSWEAISPDLTRNDTAKMSVPQGGPITFQVVISSNVGSIMTFVESPHKPGVFWAGTDDGLVQISHNDGQDWQEISPLDMPYWAHVNNIELSVHDPAVAYMSATAWKQDDFKPYVWKTDDYGQTWEMITAGVPIDDIARVVRADPDRSGLLYLGTETGVYVSFNDGAVWQSLKANMPPVPVHDMMVKEKDLIAATHGRSFWIMDDLTPLHQISQELAKSGQAKSASAPLFRPRDTYRPFPPLRLPGPIQPGVNYEMFNDGVAVRHEVGPDGKTCKIELNAGRNPPIGVIITYYLKEHVPGQVSLAILDNEGKTVRSFSSEKGHGPAIPKQVGANRFIWDGRHPGGSGTLSAPGPLAVPGSYHVRLTVKGETFSESFELLQDPRTQASQADLVAQRDLLLQIHDRLSETNAAVARLRNVREQVEAWESKSAGHEGADQISKAAASIKSRLDAIEDRLVTVMGPNPQQMPPTRLAGKLVSLISVVQSADWVPTAQSVQVFQQVTGRIQEQLQQLRPIIEGDVETFGGLLKTLGVPAIVS